jgi:hypothetical protein
MLNGGAMRKLKSADGYKRPEKTYQEKLSNADIKEKLKDYKKVSDIKKVSIGTHLRYISIDPKTGDQLFRLGGTLNKVGTNGEYIILSNGTVNWSVQINNTIFFQKMTENEIKEEIKNELKKEIITEMGDDGNKSSNSELKKENKLLLKKLNNLESDYNNLKLEYLNVKKQLENIETTILKEKTKKR